MKGKSILLTILLFTTLAASGIFMSYSFRHWNFIRGEWVTVVSQYDIPNAELVVSDIGQFKRYEVTIPAHSPLENGTFMIKLVLGNPQTGSIHRIAYGLFGSQARIGGSVPLGGTVGGLYGRPDDPPFFKPLTVGVDSQSIWINIDRAELGSASVIWAAVYGTDEDLGLEPGVVPIWDLIPNKVIYRNLPPGTFFIPTTPANTISSGGPVGFSQKDGWRDIGPGTWGPPDGRWQPDPDVPPARRIDFDGDSLQGFQLPGGDLVPGGDNLRFGAIVLDNAYITFVLWRDRNRDGIIQRNECFGFVGQCVFTRGDNATRVYKDDATGQRYIVVVNLNLGPNTEYGVPPGGAIEYTYNVDTHNLTVKKVFPDGAEEIVYVGPGTGYAWEGLS